MKGLLRRLKGILGIGAIWGAVGTVAGVVAGVVVSLTNGLPLLSTVVELAVGLTGVGFLLGGAFATVFTVLEGRRRFDQLSTGRAALLGGAAGAGVVGVWSVFALLTLKGPAAGALVYINLPVLVISAAASYGVLTAALAAGTVALAKRAPDALESGEADTPDALPAGDG